MLNPMRRLIFCAGLVADDVLAAPAPDAPQDAGVGLHYARHRVGIARGASGSILGPTHQDMHSTTAT